VFAVASAASLEAAAVLLRLRYEAPPRPAAPRGAHLMDDVAEDARVIIGNRDLAMFTGLGMAHIYVGCTDGLHCRRCTGSVTYRRARSWNTDRRHCWCSGRCSLLHPS
jgi:hypothetical protein